MEAAGTRRRWWSGESQANWAARHMRPPCLVGRMPPRRRIRRPPRTPASYRAAQGAAPATINLAEAGALSGNFGPQRQHSADYSIGGLSGGSGSRHGSSASLSTLGQQHAEDRGALDAPRMRHYPLWAFSMAAVTNTIARLGWAVYISPGQQVVQQHVILLLGCVELLRRAQWAAFRLEWEHHNRSAKAAADKTAAEAKALAEAQQRWENLQWERHRRMPFGF